ncbi:MAG: IclR family transcriptional regulator [Comamonas sp.]
MTSRTTPSSAAGDNGVAGTAAFSKFMRVLQLVADSPEPVAIADMARATGFPRPTVHRIVAALEAERMLVEAGGSRSWTLGPRLIQLASRSWSRSGLRLAALDALRALRDETGETIHFAVPSGHSMVYIEKLESPSAVQMASRIGTSVCLHSTAVGKAYLAALAPEAAAALIAQLNYERQTPQTVAGPEALAQQLAQVRARGWSTDAQENEDGIHCFGGAVLGPNGQPVAAISVSTLVFRQKGDVQASYIQPLLRACAAIGQQIAQNPNLVNA